MPYTAPTSQRVDRLKATVMTSADVAAELGVSERTLRHWRAHGIGPAYYRPDNARVVLYHRDDVTEFDATEAENLDVPEVPDCIARVVDEAPELSESQRRRLAEIIGEEDISEGPVLSRSVQDPEALKTMTPKELAAFLVVTEQTLRNWRKRGYGPSFIHPEGTNFIRYRRSDVDEWVQRSQYAGEDFEDGGR